MQQDQNTLDAAARLRPRRSVLYISGANERALEKARALDADTLIFDLEDAVAPESKALARQRISTALSRPQGYGYRERIVRINALATPWGQQDLAWLAEQAVDGILLPKVESAAAVQQARQAMLAAGCRADLPLWVMVETPLGVLRADAIAEQGVAALVAGTSDLAKALDAHPGADRLPLLFALSQIVLAARAWGCVALDGVHGDLEDDAGLERMCRQGRELGFDGKTLIHPRQLAPANAAFSPSEVDVSVARKRVEAWAQAQAQGLGVVVVDGVLVERLHVDAAEVLLARAAQIAARASA
ncbi:HpcH/HpaI aldolase/citrate lyase family protein [Kerstersia similis]|uniref:HpcH/HpaI aldolase/citrate lyase family protein n=1 Tax=Kerstersia similis TaxID=206505 RepID=UPI0039EF529C